MSGWTTAALGDVFDIARGGSPRPIDAYVTDDPKGINWVMIGDASDGSKYITKTKKRIRAEGAQRSRRVKPGDFLLTNSMSFGKPYIMRTDGCIHDGWLVLSPRNGNVDPDFFYHLLGSTALYSEFERRASGATVKNLNIDLVRGVTVPLPPISEQRRIANILDNADALRAKRRAALKKLDELTQSIFLDMFGDPATNPKGWPECTFGDLFEICSSKRVHERDWKQEGIPFYRAREIVKLAKNGHVDNDLFISESLFKQLSSNGSAPQPGDLMVSAVGTLGACYEVRAGDRFYFKDASVLRFIPKNDVVPSFVRCAFSTSHVVRQIHGGSGSTVGTYTIARAKQTRFYAPPVALQQYFARLLGRVASQRETESEGTARVDALFASLQHRAFRGEL